MKSRARPLEPGDDALLAELGLLQAVEDVMRSQVGARVHVLSLHLQNR